MDINLLSNAGLSAGTISVILIIYHIGKAIINKRIVSDCCGRRGEVGIGIRNMPETPPQETPPQESKPQDPKPEIIVDNNK